MLLKRRIRVGSGYITAICLELGKKNLPIIKGSKGYIMCGYLNLSVADQFKDVAVKITGVATITEALKAAVAGCTSSARKMGICKGQPISEVIKIIA